MANKTLTDDDLKSIADIIMHGPIFGHTKKGGENDNSDIITQMQKSDKQREKVLRKENEKLFRKLEKDLNTDDKFSDFAAVLKKNSQSVELKQLADQVKKASKVKFESQDELDETLEKLATQAALAGTTLKELGIEGFKRVTNASQKQLWVIKDGINIGKKLNDQAEEEYKITKDAIDAQRELNEQYDEAEEKLGKFSGVVKAITRDVGKLMETEQRYAQATATADAGWIKGIYDMGTTQLEYMKILKETRQEHLAANTAGVDFKASLSESAKSLHGLTGNYQEAAVGAMHIHKNMARLGVSQDQLGDAVAAQTTMYDNNYRALGFTVEEFNNLTHELINDQGMRSTLLGLQENERKAYILSVQQRQAEYLTMGYTIERAKELQKTFQALNKQSPKERMKQAARTRAMMGAMGMGAEGARLFELQTQYRTMGPKQKAAAEKEMAEIQAAASKKFGQMSGSGASMGQAMVMQTMADKTGFTQIADTFETETGQGLKFAKEQLDVQHEISAFAEKILGAMDYWGAAEGSSIGKIGTNIASMLGSFLLEAAKLFAIAKIMGIGGGMGGIGGGLMKGAGGLMKGAGGLIKGAGGMAMGAGAGILSGVKGVGAAAGGAMGKIAGGLSKAAGKTALKAIPGIGLIVSMGLMGSRLADGDYMGAGMELLAGGASLLPGIGTAASIGMSGAIVARDLAKGAPSHEQPELEDMSLAEAETMKREDVLLELNTTLLSLNDYLINATDTGSAQVKAIDKQTSTLQVEQRMNGVLSSRTAT